MDNLFSTICYLIFGRRWVYWNLRNGNRTALWVKKTEVAFNRKRLRESRANKEKAEKDLEEMRERFETKKSEGKLDKEQKKEYRERINDLDSKAMIASKDYEKTKQQHQQANDIAIDQAKKYDFVKNYKPEFWD